MVLARTDGVLLIAGWVMTAVKVVLKDVVDVVSAEIGIDALRLPIGVAEELLGVAWNTDTELEVLPTEAEIWIDALRLPTGVAEELLGVAWNADTELEVPLTEAKTVPGRGIEEEPCNAAMEVGVLITTVSVVVEEPPLRVTVVVKVNATLAGETEG